MQQSRRKEERVTDDLSGMVDTTEKTEGLVSSEIVRTEANLANLPFFALSRQDATRKTKTEYRVTVERDGQKLEASWRVTANAEYGYPRPFDRKVHKAIEYIINEQGIPIENPMPFSLYQIIKILDLNPSGRTRQRIRQSLLRIFSASVTSEGTFYSKTQKRYISDSFHIYDRVVFKEQFLPNGEAADTNYLFLSQWYLDSINNFYVRPIDFDYFLQLRSDIAGRLYELLGLKFYGVLLNNRTYWRVRYQELCDLLPITQQKYYSDACRILLPAHRQLTQTGFLTKVEWEKESRNVWYIEYYPGKRAREELARTQRELGVQEQLDLSLREPEKGEGTEVEERRKSASGSRIETEDRVSGKAEDLRTLLIERGVAKRTASALVKKYARRIAEKAEIFGWIQRNQPDKIKDNPAGYLRQMIEEDWAPPANFVSKAERERREKEAEQKRRKREQAEAQQIAEAQKVSEERKGRMEESPYRDVWGRVKEQLRGKMVSQSFSSWIAPLYIRAIEDNKVVIDCPSAFALDLLEESYRSTLEEAVAEVQGRETTVELLCKEEGKG